LVENPFDLLVQLSNPMIEVGIAFKVKSIDLGRNVSAGEQSG
jgi:hypothetical protein